MKRFSDPKELMEALQGRIMSLYKAAEDLECETFSTIDDSEEFRKYADEVQKLTRELYEFSTELQKQLDASLVNIEWFIKHHTEYTTQPCKEPDDMM